MVDQQSSTSSSPEPENDFYTEILEKISEKKIVAALELLERAKDLDPDRMADLRRQINDLLNAAKKEFSLGDRLEQERKWPEAAEAYQRAMEIVRDFPEVEEALKHARDAGPLVRAIQARLDRRESGAGKEPPVPEEPQEPESRSFPGRAGKITALGLCALVAILVYFNRQLIFPDRDGHRVAENRVADRQVVVPEQEGQTGDEGEMETKTVARTQTEERFPQEEEIIPVEPPVMEKETALTPVQGTLPQKMEQTGLERETEPRAELVVEDRKEAQTEEKGLTEQEEKTGPGVVVAAAEPTVEALADNREEPAKVVEETVAPVDEPTEIDTVEETSRGNETGNPEPEVLMEAVASEPEPPDAGTVAGAEKETVSDLDQPTDKGKVSNGEFRETESIGGAEETGEEMPTISDEILFTEIEPELPENGAGDENSAVSPPEDDAVAAVEPVKEETGSSQAPVEADWVIADTATEALPDREQESEEQKTALAVPAEEVEKPATAEAGGIGVPDERERDRVASPVEENAQPGVTASSPESVNQPPAVEPVTTEEADGGEEAYWPPGTRLYTVQKGDTLETIARKMYGAAHKWSLIANSNSQVLGMNPDKLLVGMQLVIPPLDIEHQAADRGRIPGLNDDGTYTVQSGDTLGKIARKLYGSGKGWWKLYELNRDVLSQPGRLKVGMVLRLEKLETEPAGQGGNEKARKAN